MSQPTPFKASRHERHLERQRGAGFRTLTTTFEFSFGLPPASRPNSTPTEPIAKKRKIEETSGLTAAKAGSDHDDVPTRPRRRFEAIAEELDDARKNVLPEDNFFGATKSVKKRGRPRKNVEAETGTNDGKAAQSQPQMDTINPGRRPRRQAATTAMVKVAEGFLDEEAPIDKKRRDPEDGKTTRGRRGKVGNSVRSTEKTSPLQPLQPESNITVNALKATGEKRGERSGAVNGTNTGNFQVKAKVEKRIPLAKTNANTPHRSSSPKKSAPHEATTKNEGESADSPHESPVKLSTKILKSVRPARKATRVYADQELLGNDDTKGLASVPTAVAKKKREPTKVPITHEKKSADPPAPEPLHQNEASTEPVASQRVPKVKRETRAAKVATAIKASTKTSPFGHRDQARQETGNEVDDDVDWLFDKTTRKGPSTKAQRPAAKRNSRRIVAKVPDNMDLDDLLSNIASFVPHNDHAMEK